ncbi:MAG: nitroreductase family protein [Firmicutes bacterium]|jgi:nitroreductase|nr:nitroreductase family protein [Candidatus Fermentithermobacillaceae bacterium]
MQGGDHQVDVIEAIKKRRSIRRYKDTPVPEDVLKEILDCARLAPSAGNRQPWMFYVVKNPDVKQKLVEASGNQVFLAQAPVVIVVCGDPEVSAKRYEDRGRSLYYIQDTAAAVQNIMLAAVGFGLGTCWVGAFRETMVREALDLPANLRPVAMIPIGYPDQERETRNLRPHEMVVREI